MDEIIVPLANGFTLRSPESGEGMIRVCDPQGIEVKLIRYEDLNHSSLSWSQQLLGVIQSATGLSTLQLADRRMEIAEQEWQTDQRLKDRYNVTDQGIWVNHATSETPTDPTIVQRKFVDTTHRPGDTSQDFYIYRVVFHPGSILVREVGIYLDQSLY